MKLKSSFTLIGLVLGLLMILTFTQAGQIRDLKDRIGANESVLIRHESNIWDIVYEVTGNPLATGAESRTYYGLNEKDMGPSRIDKLEEEIWGDRYINFNDENYDECGYASVKPGCPDSRIDINENIDWSWYIERHSQQLQILEYGVMELDKQINFPYVSQLGPDAPYANDCGPAAISMVTKFYGIDNDHTVKWIHDWMADGDLLTNYMQIVDMLENYYHLNTEVIATHPAIKEDLIKKGYADAENIVLIEPADFPDHVPVIWIYSAENHWIVRYKGWAYDSLLGIRRFEATENIYRPDYGLGIVVTI